MDTASRKIVAVLGATGQQGGSVVQELLRYPDEYIVRGLTRNLQSPKSQSLANLGVDMRQADVSDAESLQSAFKNVHVIYAMTDFWQTMSGDVEYTQGKTIVDIAENLPGLEHFVWASLPDAKRISNGRFSNVFHWQSKAAVADYIKNEKPRLWTKTTVVLFPNYFENCLTQANLYLPVKQKDGVYERSFPLSGTTALPNVAISDTGKLVNHVIRHNEKYQKQAIAFFSEALTEQEKAEAIGRVYKIPVRYKKITEQEFRSQLEEAMGPTTALDFTEQLLIFEDCGMIYDLPEYLQANSIAGLQLTTWEEFITSNDVMSLQGEKGTWTSKKSTE